MAVTQAGNGANGSMGHWSSRATFLLAAVGAAVGLGNLWRFPFQTGQNGGAAFVLIYLACVVLIGLPVLMGEFAIGRSQGASPVKSIRQLSASTGRSGLWAIGGWLGASASILVLPIYSVVAGKIMAFSVMSFTGMFAAGEASESAIYGEGVKAAAWMTAFLLCTIVIVARGLRNGVELAVSVLMPVFFLLLVGLSATSLVVGDSAAALDYLFAPRFDEVTAETVLAALGQALFSLAVGGAVMIAYGAFLDEKIDLGGNAAIIAGADTLVALVAGLMIFPIIFAYGLDPKAGMGLIFDALPRVFLSLPFGELIGGVFFVLAFVAALTSSISMLMMAASLGRDEFGWGQGMAIAMFGGLAFVLGGMSVFNEDLSHGLDFAVGGVLLPLGAFSSALVAGWLAPREVMRAQLSTAPALAFHVWRFSVRYAAPIAIAAILIFGVDEKFNLGLAKALAGVFGG